ncbi:uncharacterized protein CPAR2_700600 [Candida parapsilosis]|uniref:RBR-type E3 ubiquitin transferase n=1 Tax=Candida parapsilosis (strain CDC 317 / ATCC MYA-4646) TaxID=578454 RepID=G8BL67_CANPC|nr:uncharacterized protein CPAR2_700600 [Candida parapsilosis]CCE45056.1 hypothetical protein CPAR2_700600 [Candida parapsilosis]
MTKRDRDPSDDEEQEEELEYYEFEESDEEEFEEGSNISFESDDGELFDTEKSLDTPQSKFNDDAVNVGYNGTPYHPWSIESFIQSQFLNALKKLQSFNLEGCSVSDLLAMLYVKKWQSDEVLDAYFGDKGNLMKQCGLPCGKSNNNFETANDFTCFICCDTYPSTQVYSLTCNHQFCIQCYHHYVMNEVNNGRLITCMDPSCRYTIPFQDIAHMIAIIESEKTLIVAEKPLRENPMLITAVREWVDTKNNFKWCPATDCTSFTEIADASSIKQTAGSIDLSLIPIVGCAEHHEFCFECNYENHLPCPCWLVKAWVKKCEDDSETANWIDANTHSCPKCHTSIEKNGGCNHMTCRKCKHEFCWICFGDWSSHSNNYSCNRFKDNAKEDEIRKNKSRATLERYLHFYKRYSIHESSMKGDQKTLQKIDNVTKLYMEETRKKGQQNLSWNDVQFLPDAMRALQNGRKTLKWTYCFAFYLAKSNFSQIFETNQDFLNKTVEDLSEVFEKIIAIDKPDKVETILERKKDIINLAEFVNLRRKTLVKSAEENLKEKLLRLDPI